MNSPASKNITTETTEGTEKNNSVDAYVIGKIQLETAIDLYNQGNFICAITLARAAEEYLGKLLEYVTDKREGSALHRLKNNILEKHGETPKLLNYIANNIKHFEESFCEQEHNVRLDAIQLILRALTNYITLKVPFSKLMRDFYESHQESDIDNIVNSVVSVPSVVNNNLDEKALNQLSGKKRN